MSHFDLRGLEKRKKTIEKLMAQQDFWEDTDKSNKILQENKTIEVKDINILLELSEDEGSEQDQEMESSIIDQVKDARKNLDRMTMEMLFSGQYDSNNAILSVNSGTGGLDAQDWAQMLLRMYIRWSESSGYKVKLIDLSSDPEAGIKAATILVQGQNAYGYLKSEKGVHRLVRFIRQETHLLCID